MNTLRDDLGRFKKGNIPYTKLFGHSEKTKEKLSQLATGKPSPKKGKKYSPHTKEVKIKISNGVKNNLPKTVFKKGHKTWNKNRSWPQEIKDKISKNRTNKGLSKEDIIRKKNHRKFLQRMYDLKRREFGKLKKETIREVYKKNIKKYNRLTCVYCLNHIIKRSDSSLDHIIPLANGGNHHKTNLNISCKKCNSTKGKKELTEFLKYQTLSIIKELVKEGRIGRLRADLKYRYYGKIGEDIWTIYEQE